MNDGQKQFLNFFMERVQLDKKEQAMKLLTDSFKAQLTTPLSKDAFLELKANMLPLIKPEAQDEVQQAMNHFGAQFK